MEQSLIIFKPDALQRNLVGEIIRRFEQKGLKIIGLKMLSLDDTVLDEHYAHHKDKPFFADLKNFMKSYPVIVMALQGPDIVDAIRLIVGSTNAKEADAGTIRGDFGMSNLNLVHASDSAKTGKAEIKRFFKSDELFEYDKITDVMIYEE
ncbi:MAG: nucleoside-diphosphate kinase [Candidatus Buchananbacteria bacterium CG10_big_fil_rev_8_21_14_0_10_42_9]|uniref:Nucleoside diphosphate kinase n=1 Tax=Candidatus Buchananbacteria bacterium CG10_big_fil_rev_8_21_14_0_10_42_9 TaxID=1974526 RepID=A0A2H0W263_9BACT|nr:MAG: nucleoside-diphosphate kinase [Candidatus Buchananbacteria bacterium CG10_big_fil_rev_8_21_14_0_10_42_9]